LGKNVRTLSSLLFIFCVAARAAAEIQFVGAMVSSNQKLFALRSGDGAPSRWLTMGDSIAGFVIADYDPKTDTLTLRKGTTTLALELPQARVRMAKDETIAGLKRVLNLPAAVQFRDLLHPKLKPLFREEDVDSKQFPDLRQPGVKLEVLPLTEEEQKFLDQGLSTIEKYLGARPTHGVWIKTAKSASMSFVIEVGGSWFLAPSVPGLAVPE
jgi:hypothetical protein